jgi:hypothetical protein
MSNKKKRSLESNPQLRKSLENELGDLDEQIEKINALYGIHIHDLTNFFRLGENYEKVDGTNIKRKLETSSKYLASFL